MEFSPIPEFLGASFSPIHPKNLSECRYTWKMKGVSITEILIEQNFDPKHLDRIENSKRYFHCKAFARFGDHEHMKTQLTICHRHWASAHAWCIINLKIQQILLGKGVYIISH